MSDIFNMFIEDNCIEGATEFVPMSTLIPLFMTYFKYHEPNTYNNGYLNGIYISPESLLAYQISQFCLKRGYIISAGFNPSTYCVIGLSIVRIRFHRHIQHEPIITNTIENTIENVN